MKKIPHTFVLIFFLLLLSALLTWIIPGGEYTERTFVASGVEQKVMEFHYVENINQWWQVFSSFYKGFERQAGIIVFILLIGGSFWILNQTRAIDAGIFAFIRQIRKLSGRRFMAGIRVEPLILSLIWILFSVFGAVFGMSEETIAFIVVLVPLALSLGYDSITGVCMVFVAAGIGFAGAVLNPFTIGIAQSIAELPLFSGFGYRLFCWIVLNAVALAFVLRYAARVKKNPALSPVYETDKYWRDKHLSNQEDIPVIAPGKAWWVLAIICFSLIGFSFLYPISELKIGTLSVIRWPLVPVLAGIYAITGILALRRSVHGFLLHMLTFTIVFLIAGVMAHGWYIMEIAALFFAMGFFAGLSARLTPNQLVAQFMEGIRDILPAGLVVGLAGGIIVILEDGQVIDTILYSLSSSMRGLGEMATVSIMYLIQTAINLVMVSGSAKAALTMPIFAPLSDLIGLSRQTAVLAFQFGDGFTNMITPVSAVLMGVLGVAKIPYEKWFRWVLPLILILFILGLALLIPPITFNLRGF